MPEWLLVVYVFAFGAIVGSFLNVVIHRYPREESIVFPASHCPDCNARIKPWDNVPIVSYIVLSGRCRSCRARITPRYPLVEAANGLLYAAVYLRTGWSPALPLLAAFISLTILLIFIDLDIQILPDVIDKPGIALGLFIGALELGQRHHRLVLADTLVESIGGAALGWGVLFAMGWLYRVIRRSEGMGQGDMKMLAMIGAFLGWKGVLPVLFLASVLGTLIGIPILYFVEKDLRAPLPFGVFLGIASISVLLFGTTLLEWYLRQLTV